MACVLPLSSRASVTTRCTGWTTVTFGGGGGCSFGFSLQPGRARRSTDSMTRTAMPLLARAIMCACSPPSPIREPRRRLGFTRGRQIVVRRGEQATPIRPLSHLRLDLGRNEILPFPDFPAPSERSVHADQACRDRAERAGQSILLAQERLLGGEDGREVHHAFSILQKGHANGCARGRDALGQEIGPLLRLEKRRQVVLHIPLSREHRILIGNQQLLEPRVLCAD